MCFLYFFVVCYILRVLYGEVEFQAWKDSNQIWYPSFVLLGASGSCGLTVSKFQLWQRNTNSWRDWNDEYDEPEGCTNDCVHRYAWDYSEAFDLPLSVKLIKSNGAEQQFDDVITAYDTTSTWSTGREFCPTPSPTAPSNNPTPAPTDNPTPSPTDNPTPSPTDNPTPSPTGNPTIQPSNNPSKQPTNNPTNTPTAVEPTTSPSKNPTISPTVKPTDNPSSSPTKNPTIPPTVRPTATPTSFPTSSHLGGSRQNDDTTTTAVGLQDEEGVNKGNGFSFSSNNSMLVTIFATVIGTLGLCICILLGCYCRGRQKDNNNAIPGSMQLARVVTDTTMHANTNSTGNGTSAHVMAEPSTEIDTAIIQPDSPMTSSMISTNEMEHQYIKHMSIVSQINGVHYQPQQQQQEQQQPQYMQQASFPSLPPQPMVNMDGLYTNTMALQLWLNNCGLPQYYDLFVEHGFNEQIVTIIALNDVDLQNMGITKLAHRRAILNQIDIMKMAQQNGDNYEGEVNNMGIDVVANGFHPPDEDGGNHENGQDVMVTHGGPNDKDQNEMYKDSSSEDDDDDDDVNMYKKGNGQIPSSPKG